jgi:ATP-dependent DNA helicase RecQ
MLLRYFGDESAPCGNCDVCLDPVDTREGTAEARLVLDTVRRTGQKFGAAHIVNLLRGAKNEKTASFGHEALPGFGAGADRSQSEWQGIIRQMVAAGLLDIDIAGYGGLRATAAGLALMRGEGAFRYRPDRLRKEPKGRRMTSAAAKAVEGLDEAGGALLQRLKALRLELAKARRVPAYVIFSDRTLADMAAKRPRNEDEFAEVFGVGDAKRREFARLFLQAIGSS